MAKKTTKAKRTPSRKDQKATGGAKGRAAFAKLRSLISPKIRVHVSDAIIAAAYRANSGHCGVSDGVKMAAPWATHVASDLQSIRLTDPRKGLRYTYLTPRTAQLALLAFDQGKVPPAFEFTLRAGHIATSYKKVVLPNGQVKRHRHKLGKRRLLPSSSGNYVPGTIGGKSGAVASAPLRHIQKSIRSAPLRAGIGPNGGYRREFGLRAFTGAFRLEDLETVQVPIGAPSLSNK